MSDARQEIQWVVLAQSGDAEALAALLEAIQEPLYLYILRVVGDEHLAEDVLQEVFILTVRKLYWLREPGLFRPWVYRIASRQAFHSLRRERRHSRHSADDAVLEQVCEEAPAEAPDAEALQRITEMLREISPASRAVLSLHYFEGMTLQEVADVLGISLAAVKSRLNYGLSVLRTRLSPSRD